MQDQETTNRRMESKGALPSGASSARSKIPRIYVACLAAYNNGKLHGAWIDADDPDQIWDAVRGMLAASPEPGAEEWAIHDYEGFEGASLSEWTTFETVCALAEFISEYGELGARVYSYFGDQIEEAQRAFEEYAGEFQSLGDFAAELYEEIGEQVPQQLQHYIDWDAFGRDMELSGDVFTFEIGFQKVHVFWSR